MINRLMVLCLLATGCAAAFENLTPEQREAQCTQARERITCRVDAFGNATCTEGGGLAGSAAVERLCGGTEQ